MHSFFMATSFTFSVYLCSLIVCWFCAQNWRDLFKGVCGAESSLRQLVFKIVPHLSSANKSGLRVSSSELQIN